MPLNSTHLKVQPKSQVTHNDFNSAVNISLLAVMINLGLNILLKTLKYTYSETIVYHVKSICKWHTLLWMVCMLRQKESAGYMGLYLSHLCLYYSQLCLIINKCLVVWNVKNVFEKLTLFVRSSSNQKAPIWRIFPITFYWLSKFSKHVKKLSWWQSFD